MRAFIDNLVYKLAVLTDKLADILWQTRATQRYVIREAINEREDYPYTYYEGIIEYYDNESNVTGEEMGYMQVDKEEYLSYMYPNYENPAKNTPPNMNPIEKMLNDAIEREDYELAAQLKLDLERYNSKDNGDESK